MISRNALAVERDRLRRRVEFNSAWSVSRLRLMRGVAHDLFEHSARTAAPSLSKVLVLTLLVQVLATGTALVLTPIAPVVAADFGVDAHMIGYQVSLVFAAGAFGSALAGALIRRLGAVRVEQMGMAMFAVGLLGLAAADIVIGVVATLLIGFALGFQNPASSQILGAVTPQRRRSFVFSIKQAGAPLGAVLVSLALPLLDTAIGWRMGLVAMAVLPCLLAVLLTGHKAPHVPQQSAVPLLRGVVREQRLIWKSPSLRVLSMVGFLFSSVQLSLSTFAVLMLMADGGWTLIEAASVAAGIQLAGAVGRIVWGMAADRAGSGFRVLAFVGLSCGLGLLLLPWLNDFAVPVQVALLCFLGFCLNGWNGVAMAEVLRNCRVQDVGSVMGGTLVYVFAGVTVGPASFALLYEATHSYGMTFALVSLLLLAGGVAALLVQSRQVN